MQKEVALQMPLWVWTAGGSQSRGFEDWNMTVSLPIRRCQPAGIAKHWSLELSIWVGPLQPDVPRVDHRFERWCSRPWHDYILHHEPVWLSDQVRKKKQIGRVG